MTKAVPLVLLAAATLAATGCSEQSSSTTQVASGGDTGAATIEACTLLTEQDITAATGTALGSGQEQMSAGGGENEGYMTSCNWRTPDDADAFGLVSLIVWSWPPGTNGAANYIDAFRKAAEEYDDVPEPERLPLGDEGLWDGQTVNVRKGDTAFMLGASGDSFDPKAASLALAANVLSRL
jgi:hypothetical protein